MGDTKKKANVQYSRSLSFAQQASFETILNADIRRESLQAQREILDGIFKGHEILKELNDEGIEVILNANKGINPFTVVVGSSGPLEPFIGDVVSAFALNEISTSHIETRRRRSNDGWELLINCDGTKEQLVEALTALARNHTKLIRVALYHRNAVRKAPWFPCHISELDECSHCITKYEPTLDSRHPGYGDAAYIARRDFLNSLAKQYKHGDPIPLVEYTAEEHATWKTVYQRLHALRETHTCSAYRKNIKKLEDEGILSSEKIPQIRDLNEFLQRKTGFILRPCSGLLSARDFLASLAFRRFQTTTYLRHNSRPHHSPEPDLIHELLGHVPMFADPVVAQLSQDIGLMSLGASDEQIEQLANVYWFIIEFGLCKEDGRLKAIGAGLVTAYGELQHACSDKPDHRDFDPAVTAVQQYEDSDYQPLYFVAHSIEDALLKLRSYALSMERNFDVIYDPFTRSIEVIHNVSDLGPALERFRVDFSSISLAFEKLSMRKMD
ncbi:hypothetical protein Angca_006545 [Angiostrongylus cantonensis]|nr:hypothetical protein Angca_006545 [Angiostrongylus cantonensis]